MSWKYGCAYIILKTIELKIPMTSVECKLQGSKRRSSSLEVSQIESEENVCSSDGHDGARRSRRLKTPKTEFPSSTAVQDKGRTGM